MPFALFFFPPIFNGGVACGLRCMAHGATQLKHCLARNSLFLLEQCEACFRLQLQLNQQSHNYIYIYVFPSRIHIPGLSILLVTAFSFLNFLVPRLTTWIKLNVEKDNWKGKLPLKLECFSLQSYGLLVLLLFRLLLQTRPVFSIFFCWWRSLVPSRCSSSFLAECR